MCNIIGQWVEDGEYPNDEKALEKIVAASASTTPSATSTCNAPPAPARAGGNLKKHSPLSADGGLFWLQ